MKNLSIASLLAILVLFSISNAAHGQEVPDVLYLRFNEGVGTTTVDRAIPGVGSAPTFTGSVGWETTNPKLGAAAFLKPAGTNGTARGLTNQPFSITGDWTIEFWYYGYTNNGNTESILGDASSSLPFRIYAYNSHIYFSANGFNLQETKNAYLPNQWAHLALVYKSGEGSLTVYRNGTQLGASGSQPQGAVLGITSAQGISIGSVTFANSFHGAIDELRIWNSARSAAEILANKDMELTPLSDDVSVLSIDGISSSLGCAPLSATETVGFTIRNTGVNQVPAGTTLAATLTVDGGLVANESFMTPVNLASGDEHSFAFTTTTADLSVLGAHTVDVAVSYAADLYANNDSRSATIFSGPESGIISSFPHFENFDSATSNDQSPFPFPGWENDANDGGGLGGNNAPEWSTRQGQTDTPNTGPFADHTTGAANQGYYLYVEDSQADYDAVNLLSPCIDLSTGTLNTPGLRFWLHSNNASGNFALASYFSVDVLSYPGGAVTMDVLGPLNHTGDWTVRSVDLSAFAGQTIRVRFRVNNNNASNQEDVAIDDVTFGDASVGTGQPGRPGLAVLKLNNATSPFLGQGGPASGDNGPFFTTAAVGGNLNFLFSGEPNQPFAWLAGGLNPISATYPGTIGQFDIGTTLNPLTGIPIDIVTIGNGFAPFDLISALCRTGPSGDVSFNFVNYGMPVGSIITFQAVMASSTNQGGASSTFFGAISNAIELTIQ